VRRPGLEAVRGGYDDRDIGGRSAGVKEGTMTTTPQEPGDGLSDDDITTSGSGTDPAPGDADGTDGDATDTVDGDGTDGGDADGTDGDSTDTTDGGDADGTDGGAS
jgi:hypothetical protein